MLLFTRTMGLGGTENVVLQLCEILKEEVNNVVVCSCGGVNVQRLNDLNVKHYEIPDIENKSVKNIISVIKKIRKIVKSENINIIHSHHRMAAMYARITLKRNKCIRVATAHNTFEDKKLLTKMAYKGTSIIACGEMVKKNLTDFYGISSKDVSVIRNAIDEFDGKVESIEEFTKFKEADNVIVTNVGRLSEQKGMEYFIKSLSYVKERYNNVKYVIVGSGEDECALKNLAQEKGFENDIYFMGYRKDVRNIISQSDFVVLSSLWEGLPLTPIEAFSVGKTIVATSVDGTIEIVKDGVNGYLVKAKDIKGLGEKIVSLIEDEEKRHCMEEQAYQTYTEKFSFSRFKREVLEYYERL